MLVAETTSAKLLRGSLGETGSAPERMPRAEDVWAGNIPEHIRRDTQSTPFHRAENQDVRTNTLYLKREDLNDARTFKQNGARVKAHQLMTGDTPPDAFVTASAGNHAIGVAMEAVRWQTVAEIHMPCNTPQAKRDNIIKHGTDRQGRLWVVIRDEYDDFNAARAAADVMANDPARSIALLHPFDDPYVQAGQGLPVLEMMEQAEKGGVLPTIVFVPAGGGGLLAGAAEAIKRTRPGTKVVGVQFAGNDSIYRSFHAGQLLPSSGTSSLCDGTAVGEMGPSCLSKVMQHVDDVIVVKPWHVGKAYAAEMQRLEELRVHYGDDVYDELREPAGMLAEVGAALYARQHPELTNQNWAAFASGGNVDWERVETFINIYAGARQRYLLAKQRRLERKAARGNERAKASLLRFDRRLGHAAVLNGATERSYTRIA